MANAIDDVGKPDEAIKIYRDAIKMLDDKRHDGHLSSLYYNLGVTYVRQKKYNEAGVELKKAVEYNNKCKPALPFGGGLQWHEVQSSRHVISRPPDIVRDQFSANETIFGYIRQQPEVSEEG